MQARARTGAEPLLILTLAAGVSLCSWLTACSSQNEPQSPGTQRYQLRGTVITADKEHKTLVVDHEAIPGFMEAMAMGYGVKDADSLNGIASGDQVTAQVVVGGNSTWLENIVVVKKGEPAKSPPASQLHQLETGEEVPNFVLVNQDDQRIELRQYRGKALLITFLYTRCPLPDYCPLMTRNFAEIEQALAKDPAAYAQTHLLTISFDPEYDTPKVLRAYGSKYVLQRDAHAFDHWEFASAPEAQMKEIASFFGFGYQKESGEILHGLSTTILSPDGKIYKWYYGNEWTPQAVLKDLRSSLQSPAQK